MTITQKANGCNKAANPTKNNLPFFQSYGSIFAPCQFRLPEAVIITELLYLRYENGNYREDFVLTDCFAHFRKKFGMSKIDMQKASCHLHRSGIITRSFREITVGYQIHKELDIRLNITGLTDLSEAEVC